MLYVFQVDLGCMYTFELNLSLESVSTLKNAITAKCKISVDNQVLLISGGDYLEDNFQVHQYVGAGTISNPIFLFNKSSILQPEQYSLIQQQTTNLNDQRIESIIKQIQIELENTSKMEASLKTVIVRTDIAKKLNQITTDLMSTCEQLNKDQHLMYQGWSAVIANLDDVASSFAENVKNFEESLKIFLNKRDYYYEKLKNFKNDLDILDQIKTLPSLHKEPGIKRQEEKINTDCTIDDNSPKSIESEEENKSRDDTLMNLINQKDNKNCLEKVTVYCNSMLEQFNEQLLERVKEEMNSAIKTIDDNKKIKKIESRLFNLDMLLKDVRQHVQDQNLLTFGFIQNQNSANAYNDSTVFVDLCDSHKTQLDLMFKHFNKAISIKKKFQSSKRELTYSLLTRLKTIMICETELNSLNWRVLLYSESLKKLKRSLEVVDQINLAPNVYFKVFKEINRRNKFNFFFKIWLNFIVETNSNLIETENKQRIEFRKTMSSHFLKSFFPQFDDNVPEFACNLPEKFDETIPQIDENEFIEFIEQNKQFDKSLESENNFLNGFIYRMKKMSEKISEKMNESLTNNEQDQIDNKRFFIKDEERLNLLQFVDSLFPIKQEHPDQIEQIKNRLNQEYECKLNALKLEYKLRLDEELKNLTNDNRQDNQEYLNCEANCSENGNLSSSSISNNIDQTNVDQLSSPTHSSANSNPIDKPSSSIDHYKDQSPQKVFLNYKENLFKNLINELLSIKYTDFVKENKNDFAGQPVNFLSLVSTLISIAWPKNYLFI